MARDQARQPTKRSANDGPQIIGLLGLIGALGLAGGLIAAWVVRASPPEDPSKDIRDEATSTAQTQTESQEQPTAPAIPEFTATSLAARLDETGYRVLLGCTEVTRQDMQVLSCAVFGKQATGSVQLFEFEHEYQAVGTDLIGGLCFTVDARPPWWRMPRNGSCRVK